MGGTTKIRCADTGSGICPIRRSCPPPLLGAVELLTQLVMMAPNWWRMLD
ncbi:MAG: hypothetical protein WB777_21285 [Mycobacterium sp.]